MVTFDDIPLEVQEQIFIHLDSEDLKQCSFVCTKWHDIINSNQIWLKMCAQEGIANKKFLHDSFSLIQNPTKKFQTDTKLGTLCHWRTHFNRYKFIKKNWRLGYFVLSPIRFTPIYINEQFLIQHENNELILWDICGTTQKVCSFKLALPFANVDNFVWKGDYLAYTQERHVVCLKRVANECRVVINVKLESYDNGHLRSHCRKAQLTVRLSEQFLLIQDHMNPCFLYFYDCNDGSLTKKIDLHKILGNQSIFCSCLEVEDDKVFLAYRMASNSYLIKYDFEKDIWDSPMLLPTEASDLYLSKRYVCVKLIPESMDSPTVALHIWDYVNALSPIDDYCELVASKHLPVIITSDNNIIFHSRDDIRVLSLLNVINRSFPAPRGIMKFAPIWNRYLVIMDEKGVSVWDYHRGIKLYTAFRDDCCSTFYASETNITVQRDDRTHQFFNISFW